MFGLSNSVVNHQTRFERFFGVIFTAITHVIIFLLDFIFAFFVDFCTVFPRRILQRFSSDCSLFMVANSVELFE